MGNEGQVTEYPCVNTTTALSTWNARDSKLINDSLSSVLTPPPASFQVEMTTLLFILLPIQVSRHLQRFIVLYQFIQLFLPLNTKLLEALLVFVP